MKYLYSPYNAQCPVCSNINNLLLYNVTASQAARHFLVTHGLEAAMFSRIHDKIIKLWNQDSAAIISCKNCDFVFANPFLSGDAAFYNLLPHATETDENWKWEFEKTFNKIAPIVESNSDVSLLEIGASTGTFARRVAKLVKKENILCLEYSAIGVDSIKKAGIEALSIDFRELRQKPEYLKKFNIICLFQVLEHLDKLDDTFKTFNLLIKQGGHLFIGVPNAEKIKFNELNGALLDMPPNHIGRFNKLTFKILASKYGWEIADIATEPYTQLDVMATVMYYRSLQRAQFAPVKETLYYNIRQYLEIKYIRLQAMFRHKHLGETLWIHLVKHG